ncbi:hypothetical protein E1258_16605 [Micromonospora sp. KC207]|nr:hypothetical protein E1258_16605 [Micromonospora sp. KC207]
MESGRPIDGAPPRVDCRRVARCLRSMSLFAEGAAAMALALGREDAVSCAVVLSAVLRSAAEVVEGPLRP